MSEIKIANRLIGNEYPPIVIAEIAQINSIKYFKANLFGLWKNRNSL